MARDVGHDVDTSAALIDASGETCYERHVADQLLQHRGGIGLIRLTDAPRVSGQKLLEINWTAPSAEAFGYGTYPYGVPLQLITSGVPDPLALSFLDFARSDAGRGHLGHLAISR